MLEQSIADLKSVGLDRKDRECTVTECKRTFCPWCTFETFRLARMEELEEGSPKIRERERSDPQE